MDDQGIFVTQFINQLPHRFNIGQGLNIPHGPSYFSDDDIISTVLIQQLHPVFNLVGNMGNNLYGFAQKHPLAFLFYNTLIHPACRYIIGLGRGRIEKTLVMPQVQIGLGTVFGHIAFSMLIGVECTGIYVEVGVKFLDGNTVFLRL